jgi:hypothetical protein
MPEMRLLECALAVERAADSRFITNAQRVMHRDTLNALLDAVIVTQSGPHFCDGTLSLVGTPFDEPRSLAATHRTYGLLILTEHS